MSEWAIWWCSTACAISGTVSNRSIRLKGFGIQKLIPGEGSPLSPATPPGIEGWCPTPGPSERDQTKVMSAMSMPVMSTGVMALLPPSNRRAGSRHLLNMFGGLMDKWLRKKGERYSSNGVNWSEPWHCCIAKGHAKRQWIDKGIQYYLPSLLTLNYFFVSHTICFDIYIVAAVILYTPHATNVPWQPVASHKLRMAA